MGSILTLTNFPCVPTVGSLLWSWHPSNLFSHRDTVLKGHKASIPRVLEKTRVLVPEIAVGTWKNHLYGLFFQVSTVLHSIINSVK